MPKYTALIVGTNYDKFPAGISGDEQARAGLYLLRYAEADAQDMAAELENAGCRVVVLLGQEATRDAVLSTLRQLRDEVGAGGPFVFYFSGHGVLDNDGTAYLMPVDANAQTPDVRGIPLSDVTQRYLFKVGTAVALLDCCHSGYAAGVRGTPVDRNLQFLKEVQAAFGQTEGHRILAACGGDEVARELEKLQHGAFTYYALDHLRNYTGEVDVDSLYARIARGLQSLKLQPPVSGGRQKGLIVLRAAREAPAPAAPTTSAPVTRRYIDLPRRNPPVNVWEVINPRARFPELTDTDLTVLKLVGDYTLAHGRQSYMNPSDLLEQATANGIEIELSDLLDSLEVLGDAKFITGEPLYGQRPFGGDIECTTWGFQQYADLYLPEYPNIRHAVMTRLVQTEERKSDQIAPSLGQPQMLIEHIFVQLKHEGLILDIVQTFGGPMQVVGDLPVRLRRMVKEKEYVKLDADQAAFLTQTVKMYIAAPTPDSTGRGHITASRIFAALGWEWRRRRRADALADALLEAGLLDPLTRKRVNEIFVVPSAAGIAWVQRPDTSP